MKCTAQLQQETYKRVRSKSLPFLLVPRLLVTLRRYCNMDFMFASTLHGCGVKNVVVSYDIACQWSINFRERMNEIDATLNDLYDFTYLVPKFHLPAHVLACRSKFSFNYTRGVGRTDGEGVERRWADSNELAPSTREMGPGSRLDTLDAHFGDSNWRKIVGLGTVILSVF